MEARHDVCTTVLRNPDLGVEGKRTQVPGPVRLAARLGGTGPITPVDPSSLLGLDPPAHTRIRKLVTRAFSVRAIEALRERTRGIAEELLDDLAAESRVDLVPRYASLLPVTVISEILAVPTDMREQFLRWGDEAALSLDIGLPLRDFRSAEAGLSALQAWMREHVERLRRDPGDDVLSTVVRAGRSSAARKATRPYCLGVALARMEGEIGLRALFERFPRMAPDGAPRRRGTRTLRGYSSLPVRLGADSTARATG